MDDISFLVGETFSNIDQKSQGAPPSSGGVLYSIGENESTYIIRAIPSRNLKDDREFFEKKELHKKLKIEKESFFSQVFWFETEFWELSQLIVELATQKRFLKHSETLSNLSDPQLSWGITEQKGQLTIDWRGRKHYNSSCKRLGYLGESVLAEVRFSKLLGPEQIQRDQVILSKEEDEEVYSLLKDLFLLGKFDEPLWEKYCDSNFSVNESESILLYFREVVTMRNFWAEIFSKLS